MLSIRRGTRGDIVGLEMGNHSIDLNNHYMFYNILTFPFC